MGTIFIRFWQMPGHFKCPGPVTLPLWTIRWTSTPCQHFRPRQDPDNTPRSTWQCNIGVLFPRRAPTSTSAVTGCPALRCPRTVIPMSGSIVIICQHQQQPQPPQLQQLHWQFLSRWLTNWPLTPPLLTPPLYPLTYISRQTTLISSLQTRNHCCIFFPGKKWIFVSPPLSRYLIVNIQSRNVWDIF